MIIVFVSCLLSVTLSEYLEHCCFVGFFLMIIWNYAVYGVFWARAFMPSSWPGFFILSTYRLYVYASLKPIIYFLNIKYQDFSSEKNNMIVYDGSIQ